MKYVTYYRLSKKRKDAEQYGIDAQKEAVARYLATQQGAEVIGEFEEWESGAKNNRPKLQEAFALCKLHKATLLIARLDRLSRSASFLMSLRDSDLFFVCCDYPQMDRLMCGVLALVAEREREMISARVTAGLAAAKRNGKVLGCPVAAQAWSKAMVSIQTNKKAFAGRAMQSINEIRSTGVSSLSRISDYMNKRGEKTRLGGRWTTTGVQRILKQKGVIWP
jgi:DNA invertase Pin-like site-specific DNA recombinase